MKFNGSSKNLSENSNTQSKFPMEKGIISCGILGTEVKDPTTNTDLGRPWTTVLIDDYSGNILSFHLSIEPPTHLSIITVIKECVKRNSMLPRIVLTSQGEAFEHEILDNFFTLLGIQIIPNSKHLSEKLFINISSLIPKTNKLSKGNKNDLMWNLNQLTRLLSAIFYESYGGLNMYLGISTSGIFSLEKAKHRLPKRIEYNEKFLLLSLPQIELNIISGKGIRIHNIYYWANDFLKPKHIGRKILVKYDPINCNGVFAFLDNKWKKLSILPFNQEKENYE